MKIGVIFYKYPLYPQGSYFQEFLNKTAQSLEEVYLIATQYPKGNFKKTKNIKIFWVPRLNIRFLDELFFMLVVLFKAIFTKELHKVDLIDSIGPRGLLTGWYLKKRYHVPLICTVELLNENSSLINRIIYILSRWLIIRAPVDKIICWSNYYWQKHLREWGIPKKKVSIIPAGIDTEAYHPKIDGSKIKKRYAPDSPLIVFAKPLYSTNTEAAKLLIRSVAILKPEIKIKLLIGSGEGRKKIQSLAKNLGIGNQINFIPLVPFPKIPKYIAAADLVVLPFTQPVTTSRSLLEALALGKPVVTTPLGEVKQILEDGKNALLVEPNQKEIARAIKTVLAKKELSSRMGVNAESLVRERFSLKNIVLRTIGVFEEII